VARLLFPVKLFSCPVYAQDAWAVMMLFESEAEYIPVETWTLMITFSD
jgi:hypothetical protein